MAYNYSKQERIDLHLIGAANQCVREAIRLYKERFLNRKCPSRSSYAELIKKFEETGGIENKKHQKPKTVTRETNVRKVIAAVSQNPHVSIRELEREININKSSISRILKLEKFHAFYLLLH